MLMETRLDENEIIMLD